MFKNQLCQKYKFKAINPGSNKLGYTVADMHYMSHIHTPFIKNYMVKKNHTHIFSSEVMVPL